MKKKLLVLLLYVLPVQAIIFVFGDSHTWVFKNNTTICNHRTNVKHLGPFTMHRVGREGLGFLNFKTHGVSNNDIVVMVFGEIDARVHIGVIRDRNNCSLQEVVTPLVEAYINTILLNQSLLPQALIIIYSIVPPYDWKSNPSYPNDPHSAFPFYKEIEDRIEITKIVNKTLQQYCLLYGIAFLNVYDYYADVQGKLIEKMSDGNVHIDEKNNKMILDELSKIISQLRI